MVIEAGLKRRIRDKNRKEGRGRKLRRRGIPYFIY